MFAARRAYGWLAQEVGCASCWASHLSWANQLSSPRGEHYLVALSQEAQLLASCCPPSCAPSCPRRAASTMIVCTAGEVGCCEAVDLLGQRTMSSPRGGHCGWHQEVGCASCWASELSWANQPVASRAAQPMVVCSQEAKLCSQLLSSQLCPQLCSRAASLAGCTVEPGGRLCELCVPQLCLPAVPPWAA